MTNTASMVCLKLLPVIMLCLGACAGSSGEKTLLHFSYITTKTGSFVAAGALPVVDLALELINNRTDILPNYNLSYTTILDNMCDNTASLDSFMKHFRDVSEPTYVSLFCCGCSTADITVAEISHYWNVPQMAGTAAADVLSDRQRFRGFYRTEVSSEFVGPALAEMARYFNWTQMAVVIQRESLFIKIAESLNSIFKTEQRVLDMSVTFDKDASSPPYRLLHNLGRRDYRIIVLNMDETHAYAVLCEAYYLGWLPPKYVWFIYRWYSVAWWENSNGNATCSPDIVRKMLNGILTIAPNNTLVSDSRHVQTFSGLTPNEYEMEYRRRLQNEEYQSMNLTEVSVAGTEFDAAWAMAIGLHIATEKVRINDSTGCSDLPGELVPLEDFGYLNEKMGCVLQKSFQEVNFHGITGPVAFNSNGSRDARVIRVQQYQVDDNGAVEISSVYEVVVGPNSSRLLFRGDLGVRSLWADGAPYDGAARERLHLNSPVLVSLYSIAAIAGIAFAGFCLVFNTVFRNKRVVKLSSRNLNYLIVAGATLLYVSVFLYTYSERDHQDVAHGILCNFRQGSFSFGYTLCFAVILAKTWRVYHIFFNPKPKKKVPKDWLLFVIVVVVVAVDLLVILVGTVISSSRLRATRIEDLQHPVSTADGITFNNYVYICLNEDAIVWLAISYAYKGLLQLVAMFMAFHTRRVNIKVLNDSKEIAVIVYINSIILALLVVVEFALSRYHEVYTALFGLALLLEATVFLALIFIPKMVHLSKDPKGETALDPSSNRDTLNYRHSIAPTNKGEELSGPKQQEKLAEVDVKKKEHEDEAGD